MADIYCRSRCIFAGVAKIQAAFKAKGKVESEFTPKLHKKMANSWETFVNIEFTPN
jgi:hypothetical protein